MRAYLGVNGKCGSGIGTSDTSGWIGRLGEVGSCASVAMDDRNEFSVGGVPERRKRG